MDICRFKLKSRTIKGSFLKKVAGGSERRELAKALVQDKKNRINRACKVMNMDRKSYYYELKLKLLDLKIKESLKQLFENYPEYGFKKLFGLLKMPCNHKRAHRLYCESGLNLKRKPKKRLAPRTAQQLLHPSSLNECGSLDFMSDALLPRRRFRTLNVLDDCKREGLGIKVSFSLSALKIEVLI